MKSIFLVQSLILHMMADHAAGVKCYNCQASEKDLHCLTPVGWKGSEKYVKSCVGGCSIRFGEYGKWNRSETYFKTTMDGKPNIYYGKRFGRGCDDEILCETGTYVCCSCNFNFCNGRMVCATLGNSPNNLQPSIIILFILKFVSLFI